MKLQLVNNNANYLIKGKGEWVKILGQPHPGYTEGDPATAPREWSMDLVLDETGQAQAKRLGIGKKVRNKAGKNFLTFRRREFKGDGHTANQPIKVVDHHNNPWDRSKLIGNGSTLNVSFKLFEGKKGPKPVIMAVQVWDHKPYVGKSDFPVREEENWTDDVKAAGPGAMITASEDDGEVA